MVAKVFGELYFLLEYRDEPANLQYSDEPFSLPKNLYIIGTMNHRRPFYCLGGPGVASSVLFRGVPPRRRACEGRPQAVAGEERVRNVVGC